eukprot:FR735787.1.p1 GENE.FR735787.1~~FR735787.1.p1  ORF type:complete len:157 (+),score=23.38 FR735787.1:44-472(+)
MESKRGNYERARELFEKGIDQDPFHAQIFHAYAEMEAKLVNIPALQQLDARARELFSEDAATRQAQRILAAKHAAARSLDLARGGIVSTSFKFDILSSDSVLLEAPHNPVLDLAAASTRENKQPLSKFDLTPFGEEMVLLDD